MKNRILLAGLFFLGISTASKSQLSEWEAGMDNTIYSENGNLSNGDGDHFIVGNNATGQSRRAFVWYDLASNVPGSATVVGAELRFYCDQTNGAAGPQVINLHRVTAAWGEGASNANLNPGQGDLAFMNDATWSCAMADGLGGCMTSWSTPGGDFNPTPSASMTVDASGQYYTITATPQLIADLQDMVDNPGSNFGFILVGNESSNTTAKRFASLAQSGFEPQIRVFYVYNSFCSLNDYGVTATPSNLVCGGSVNVALSGSEAGVDYYLQDPNTLDFVAGPVVGTGSGINLPVNVSSSATYNVFAELFNPSGGLDFDGANDHVNAGNNLSAALIGIPQIAVEAWVNPSSTAGLGVIVGNYSFPTNNNQMQFLLRRDNNQYSFWVDPGTGYTSVTSGPGTVQVGTWQHVVGVWTGSELQIYIDGNLVNTATGVSGSLITTTNQVVIGGNAVGEFFQGRIDEVRIWSAARSEQDIQDNRFNCGVSDPSLLAYYRFEDGTGSATLFDQVGSGLNDGTLVNMDPATDWVDGSEVCGPFCSTFMTQQAVITVDPIADQSLTATPSAICVAPGTAQIDMSSSDVGINYVLRDDATNAVVDGPIAGTGSALSFSTGSISATTVYNVYASKFATSTGVEVLGNANTGIFPDGESATFTEFSAEAWFKQTLPASYATDAPVFLVFNEVAGNPVSAISVYMDQTTGFPYLTLNAFFPTPSVIAVSGFGTTNLLDGNWHHVALVANATVGEYELYIDGALQVDLAQPITTWTGGFVAGFDVNTFAGLTVGAYDDIRFWGQPRNGAQIMADMNSCLQGNEPGLQGYWKVDEAGGDVLRNEIATSPFGDLSVGQDNSTPGVDYNWVAGNTECLICEFEMTDIVTVTVGDTEAPMAMCQDVTVSLDVAGNASLSAGQVDLGTTDNCDPAPALSLDVTSFDCSSLPALPTVRLVITGVIDGNLPGGLPKAVQLYALANIPDLSEYGIGSANNGGGTDGEEFTFPAVSVAAGDFIYIASEATDFASFFGFAPDYVDATANINGDDAIELFHLGSVVDVFGDINVDGTGQPWEYSDGWAYRVSNTGPDGTTFTIGNWTFSGPNGIDPCANNGACANAFPENAYTFVPAGSPTVTLTATDVASNSGSCTANVIVVDPIAPTITGMPMNMTVPANNTGCTAIVTWTAPTEADNCSVVSFTSTHNSGDAFPVGTTTVEYTAVDASGNSTTESFNITVTSDLAATAVTSDLSCNGDMSGAIDLTVTGGTSPFTYAWDNGATTEDISGAAAGLYIATVTDANGCTAVSGGTLNEPAVINITVDASTDPTTCGASDGTVDVTVSGGTVAGAYTYDWNGGTFTTEDLTAASAGNWTLTVTDDNACTETTTVSLSDPNAPTVALNTTNSVLALSCNGDADGAIDIDVTLNGGATSATYNWNSGAFTTEDLTGLSAGTYNGVVTDNNNCSASASVTITEPAAITTTGVVTDPTCNGDSDGAVNITVMGGTVSGSYTFDWNSGAFITEDLSGVPANTYDVTITDDNSCIGTASFTVTDPAAVTGTTVVTDATCNGSTDGAVDLTVTVGVSPYSFLWDDAAATTTEDVSGLGAATYTVTITDADGCSGTVQATVGEPSALTASGTSTDEINGNDGAINLTVSGGTPIYTYAWTGPNGFTSAVEDPTGLEAGTYDVTVTDANGCITTAQVIVSSQVGVATLGQFNLKVLPNPSNGQFQVMSNITTGQLIVRDALGREVKVFNITGNRTDVNLEGNEDGIYFVELRSESATKTVRIVLQK